MRISDGVFTNDSGGTVDIDVEDTTTLTGAVISSTTDDLNIDTGSLVYSNIKDKDTSSNIGGGVSAGGLGSDNVTGSVNATYGYTDLRQTNFATIGEGTITVRDTEDASIALDGLNRDESISQYNTKDTGLQGGFTVDTATINAVIHPADTVMNTIAAIDTGIDAAVARTELIVDEAIKLEQQAEVIVEKTDNWIDDKGFKTDEEVKVDEEIEAQKVAEENKRKEFELIFANASDETKKILTETGWDGKPIIDENGTVILNQDPKNLAANGLPEHTGACVFLSTVDGAAKALGIELTAEQVAQIYYEAKDNDAVGGSWGTYGVDNYEKLVQAVATVAGVDPGNITVSDVTPINNNNDASKLDTSNKIVQTLDDGGAVNVRFDKDPANSNSTAHTMSVTGASIDNSGNTILHVNDTNHPDTPTFINTNTMTLYTEDDDEIKHESLRPIVNYRTITNNQGEN